MSPVVERISYSNGVHHQFRKTICPTNHSWLQALTALNRGCSNENIEPLESVNRKQTQKNDADCSFNRCQKYVYEKLADAVLYCTPVQQEREKRMILTEEEKREGFAVTSVEGLATYVPNFRRDAARLCPTIGKESNRQIKQRKR
ncbi:hypothetical protein AWC38_SpisGene22225 [Stylophora pistillata]|uniref:Uncharacterized protein n=1 Tax=Stylophora pistillata TaxID=50429 RepID=A0A2B4RBS1_STYPI|nr:hypothetical protein AWC38_SpisGene22225 [Stylophora pistillata]